MAISVALCTYNGSAFLAEQLASIAQQTRLPDELVICDDGSTDNTLPLVESFASNSPFDIRIYRNSQNLGATRNFAQAIRLCRGDIIALCDQDDFWYATKLAELETIFDRRPEVGFVFSDADIVDAQGKALGYRLWHSARFDRGQQQRMINGQAISVLLQHPVVTGAAMAFRARFRDLVLPMPSNWIHDEWIALLIAAVANVGIIEQPLMQYRRHQTNQVGIEGINFLDRLTAALSTNPAVYHDRYEQFQQLSDRIAQHLPTETDLLRALADKQDHLRMRATLPDQNLMRLLPVWKELLKGRYKRYSASQLNAFRDLILRH